MSLSYLKIRFSRYLALGLFLSICSAFVANDSIPDIAFSEQCENSDAYMLYSYTDVVYNKRWGSYRKQTAVNSKLVINNRKGVEGYAFLNLNQLVKNKIEELKIKTLKADGSVVELDSSLVFDQHSDDEQLGQINYPIPGVEPGDTIETYYVFSESLREYEMGDYINLYSNVPSYKTEFTVRTTPDFLVRYKQYNGFPEPQVLINDTILYCLFKQENISGQSQNQYTCLSCELPYVYYTLDKKDSEVRTWKEVYNQEFNFVTQPMSLDYEKSSYYKRWKRKVIGASGDSSKYYKFNLLHKAILDHVHMEPMRGGELIKSSGFFLKENRFDPISIKRIYRQILEDLEIKYWAVFARSKQGGEIDPYYIRKGEYDHIFFAYENSKGSLTFLYPHDISYMYQIDEIPTTIYNTQAVIAQPYLTEKIKRSDKFINYDLKVAEVDSVIVNVIKLPGMSARLNNIKQMYYCDVIPGENNAEFTSKIAVSGGLSTDIRGFYSLLNQNEDMNSFYEAMSEFEGDETSLEIDTVTKVELNNTKPFIYKIAAKGKLKENVTFINDSIVSITLDNLIMHSQIESESDSTNLNYYLDYAYTDLFMVILKFPRNIELLSSKDFKKEIKNECGTYLFALSVSNDKQLIIQSTYTISKDMIPKNKYAQLKQLNEFTDDIKNTRLLIKLKPE